MCHWWDDVSRRMKKIAIIYKNKKLDFEFFEASSMKERMIGLMFKEKIEFGLLIPKCNSIQTFFMKKSIDVIFISKMNEVVKILHDYRPWRISGIYLKANKTLELPQGKAKEYNLRVGEKLEISYV